MRISKSSYAQKLRDPRWQKKRLEILQRDSWTCVKCGDDQLELHVHHKRYVRNVEPWDYPDKDLETLCDECHKDKHGIKSNRVSEDREQLSKHSLFDIAVMRRRGLITYDEETALLAAWFERNKYQP